MRRAPQWLLPVSSVLPIVMAACGTSHLSRSPVEEPDLVNVRTEYLTRHPDSPYRDYVSRGKIVKGMDTFGVLASWGLPTSRAQYGMDGERWLYVDVDDVSNEPIGYALAFRKGVLKSWDMHRASGSGLKVRESSAPSDAPKDTDTQKGKPVPTGL
jgi:hypothetical protein